MQSPIAFLGIATAIAFASMHLNYRFSKVRFRADQAFWGAWLFLIWSAETLTAFPFFEYYYSYPVVPEIRSLTLTTFVAAAAGFFIGSVLTSKRRKQFSHSISEVAIPLFAQRWQGLVSAAIFAVGFFELSVSSADYTNLLDLRLAAVDGQLTTSTFYTQFFYFSQAFIMLVGFSDGYFARISRVTVGLCIGGLVLHNLSVGGRINIIVAPALYFIPFLIVATQRADWSQTLKWKVRRFVFLVALVVLALFSAIAFFRSYTSDISTITSAEGFLSKVVFAIPAYVSDTYISIAVHVSHAKVAGMPFGYYTFDAYYRLFEPVLALELPDKNTVFGHAYYRDTPAPWAWTQTNLIPRLISDFGDFFWLALTMISALVQWLSLNASRLTFLSTVVRALMIFSSAYTILSASWFTAMNVYILLYAIAMYFLASGGAKVQRRLYSNDRSKPLSDHNPDK